MDLEIKTYIWVLNVDYENTKVEEYLVVKQVLLRILNQSVPRYHDLVGSRSSILVLDQLSIFVILSHKEHTEYKCQKTLEIEKDQLQDFLMESASDRKILGNSRILV